MHSETTLYPTLKSFSFTFQPLSVFTHPQQIPLVLQLQLTFLLLLPLTLQQKLDHS